jgi:GINS complex subunit 4
MKQLLGQEKMAPDLLPYQHSLVEIISKQINNKTREITQRAEQNTRSKSNDLSDERFYLNIERMEIERVKFLLKAYLRARIIKIEKHLLYIIEKDQASLLS